MADDRVAGTGREAEHRVEGRGSGIEIGGASHGLQGRAAHGDDGPDVVHRPQVVGIEGRAQERDDPVSRDVEGVAVEDEAVRVRGEGPLERLHGAGREGVAGGGEDDEIHTPVDGPGRTPKARAEVVVGRQPQGVMVEAEQGRPGLRGADALAREPRRQDGEGVPGIPREDRHGGASARDQAGAASVHEQQGVSALVDQRKISRAGREVIRDPRRRS
ncbi:hypothetical protein FV218_07715 [Methylobacterium sp. WL69]|nr:hypothetical protein FV218_07715 [Methylobacterium sp. WL69]